MDVLKRNKKSIDFLSVNHKIYPWVTNGNYSPSKLYKNGMIEGSPFNIDSVDFLKIFEAPAFIKTEFRKQMDSAADWAKSVGMTEDDIMDAKKTVRSRKKEV